MAWDAFDADARSFEDEAREWVGEHHADLDDDAFEALVIKTAREMHANYLHELRRQEEQDLRSPMRPA